MVATQKALTALLVSAALGLGASVAQAQNYTAYGSSFGKNKIQYRELDWKIYHSPHFDIHYYAEEEALLEKIASLAESAYDRLSRDFDFQIQKPTPLVFYATHSAFEQNNIILNFIPEGVGAFASPVRNRMVLPVDLPDGELYDLILHELTHIFQYNILRPGGGGGIGRGIAAPQWVMEGMASYMAKDESASDRMFLRDAVINDMIPSILERGVGGFFAYRFGHAAFDYIEHRWGKEGFRDFVYEFRNTLGGRVEKTVERGFKIDPEDFDTDFRRWLRQQYVPQLAQTGEPGDFGRRFRYEEGVEGATLSPVASPSGDLVAALSTEKDDVDVVLFDARKRRYVGNLTKGFSSDYQYLVSQFITVGSRMGRDLAFSPDGNRLAVFAKREKGRSLVIIDVLGKKVERVIGMEVEQQHAPAFSPDGKKVAFSGNVKGRFDIFELDLASGAVVNLTDDEPFDGAPVYSPDGKSVVFSSVVAGEHAQLFRLDRAEPTKRYRLSEGKWNDKDAVFSHDGSHLYFTSDRNGNENIFGLDLASGEVRQYTNAATGCFMPTVLATPEGGERLVYTGYWRRQFDLYVTDLDAPIGETVKTVLPVEATTATALPRFEPDVQVTLDPANKADYGGFKLFVEDGGATVAIAEDQSILGYTYLSFTDYLGDRRLVAAFSSIESFSNFDFTYVDMSRRWNWAAQVFDTRTFYIGVDQSSGRFERGRAGFQRTGAIVSWLYPFDFYRRLELGAGYIRRKLDYQQTILDGNGNPILVLDPRTDDMGVVQAAFVGDTTVYADYGPVSGRRYRLSAFWGPSVKGGGGTITSSVDLDARAYLPVGQRSNFSLRLFAGVASGDAPSPYIVGGLDTIRGVGFLELAGDRAFFVNLEYRFPLIDTLSFPFLGIRGIRGRVFLDIGGVWSEARGDDFTFWNSDENRFEDAVSAYGWGFTFRFGGIDLNWDFAKRWRSAPTGEKERFETSFWIGTSF